MLIIATLLAYFLVLFAIASRAPRGTSASQAGDAFFRGGRQSPWAMVSFGMIGASISGVSFVSVPGWVSQTGMTYLQMCAGFILGYVVVAFVLLPIYYRSNLTSIYAWLGQRFGRRTHQTGAAFFLLSKLTGASARLYLACLVLMQFLPPVLPGFGGSGAEGAGAGGAAEIGSFALLASCVLALIFLYTRRMGIYTIVRTDVLQTLCLLVCLGAMLFLAVRALGWDVATAVEHVAESPMSRVFEWDWRSPQNFWRQFLSGVFIVVVMTGLDQDMMQKNLTCRTLPEAQKNMCLCGLAFLPVNALLLALGILLYALAGASGTVLPAGGDALVPSLVASGLLGTAVVVPFTIGIVAAALSSADSAVTSLTTSLCVDIFRVEQRGLSTAKAQRIRRLAHVVVSIAFLACVVAFRVMSSDTVIHTIYVLATYTYGPLLGLYAFGIFTRRQVRDKRSPLACLLPPFICAALDVAGPALFHYRFGYELLLLNGLITFALLFLVSERR